MIQELKIGSVKLQIMKGLIWLQRTDAIVCPCENTSLRHIKGIAASIQDYAGPQIFKESNELVYKQKKHGLLRGHAYETKPGMLNCRKLIHSIIHMPAGDFVSQNQHNETIREVFSKARDMDSISMPLLLQEGYTSYEIR